MYILYNGLYNLLQQFAIVFIMWKLKQLLCLYNVFKTVNIITPPPFFFFLEFCYTELPHKSILVLSLKKYQKCDLYLELVYRQEPWWEIWGFETESLKEKIVNLQILQGFSFFIPPSKKVNTAWKLPAALTTLNHNTSRLSVTFYCK
jgi:hypothetical protein